MRFSFENEATLSLLMHLLDEDVKGIICYFVEIVET